MQIMREFERTSAELIARYRDVRVDVIARLVGNTGLADPAIKPVCGMPHVVGPALTVSCIGPDSRMAILALDLAEQGDVVLIDAQGSDAGSTWGGGLTLSADAVGCEAIGVDGFAVDLAAIAECRTPVFARGVTLRQAPSTQPGTINTPIRFGGLDVRPGDLVIGDPDGFCILPREEAPNLIERAEAESRRIAAAIVRIKEKGLTIFDLRGERGFAEGLGFEWPYRTAAAVRRCR